LISKYIGGSIKFDHFTRSSFDGVVIVIQDGLVLSNVMLETIVPEFIFVAESSITTLTDIIQSGSKDVIERL
jgi:hypothetical protein